MIPKVVGIAVIALCLVGIPLMLLLAALGSMIRPPRDDDWLPWWINSNRSDDQ